MKKLVDDPRLMIYICELYYNKEKSKQEIGAELGLSRPTVNRLLAAAKEKGVVSINIPDLEAIRYWELEQQLTDAYGLKDALIVDYTEDYSQLTESLGKAAARYLQQVIREDYVVGISMGRSLLKTVENVTDPHVTNVVFVSLLGGLGKLRLDLHSNPLTEHLAFVYGGDFYPIHAPARVSTISAKRELMKEQSIAVAINLMKKLDVAVVGIGVPGKNSALMATELFEWKELETLSRNGAIGEVCMQFFDIEGNLQNYNKNNQVIGIPIERLRKVPYSIGVAGSKQKVNAILGAIRGGYINVLITDTYCARALLDEAEGNPSAAAEAGQPVKNEASP